MRTSIICFLIVFTVALPSDAQVLSPPRNPPVVKRPVAKRPVAAKPVAAKPVATKADVKQTDVSPPRGPRADTTVAPPLSARPVASPVKSWRNYRFAVFSSEIVDSNIERDPSNPVSANGFVVGAAARYQSAEIRPALSATYEIARHSYTRSEQFDRVSHNLSAVAFRRFTKRLSGEAIAEAAVKGSSEDRDVGNQYLLLPRLSYKLDDARRLRVYGAYRMRRYDVSQDRNAENRYAGAELRTDISDDARLEFGFRYETNSARAAKRSYVRRTYHTQYSKALSRSDDLSAELKYRSQRYNQRPVDEDEDNPRLDHRLSPAVQWIHAFGRGVSMIAVYDLENRASNDPGKGYRDHVFAVTARFDW